MKILDRYIIKGFLAPFVGCVVIFSVLVVLGRFFDKMAAFNFYHARPQAIALFLMLGLPYWLNLVLPVVTLIALLFSLGQFQERKELTACLGAGITRKRLLAPYFILAALLSILALVSGLSFLPKIDAASKVVYRVRIKKQDARNFRRDHVVMAGENHRRFTIDLVDVEKQQLHNVVMDRFDGQSQWVESISAREAKYRAGKWIFANGVWRHADPAQPEHVMEQIFRELPIEIPEKFSDFALEHKDPEDLTGHEILRRIRRLRSLGVPVNREQVALQLKLALPFANLVVVALGIPFALRAGQQGRTQTFTYALVLAFLYWGLTSICQSLGEQGRIPAWVAAWMSNVLFSAVAFWRLAEVN